MTEIVRLTQSNALELLTRLKCNKVKAPGGVGYAIDQQVEILNQGGLAVHPSGSVVWMDDAGFPDAGSMEVFSDLFMSAAGGARSGGTKKRKKEEGIKETAPHDTDLQNSQQNPSLTDSDSSAAVGKKSKNLRKKTNLRDTPPQSKSVSGTRNTGGKKSKIAAKKRSLRDSGLLSGDDSVPDNFVA